MAFKDSLRLEEIYFKNLKTMIERLKRFEGSRNTKELKEIIDALIECCSAVLMLYRNLGEEYNELTAQIQKNVHDLEDLKNTVEAYNGELNEKIDEINNYLMVLIRELDGRVTALETAVEDLEDAVEDLETDVSGIQTDITNFGGLPSNASASVGDVLTKGENGNEWSTPQGGGGKKDSILDDVSLTLNFDDQTGYFIGQLNVENKRNLNNLIKLEEYSHIALLKYTIDVGTGPITAYAPMVYNTDDMTLYVNAFKLFFLGADKTAIVFQLGFPSPPLPPLLEISISLEYVNSSDAWLFMSSGHPTLLVNVDDPTIVFETWDSDESSNSAQNNLLPYISYLPIHMGQSTTDPYYNSIGWITDAEDHDVLTWQYIWYDTTYSRFYIKELGTYYDSNDGFTCSETEYLYPNGII